jgi:histidinol dehydrogenase
VIPVQALTPELRARFVGRRGAHEDRVRSAVDAVWADFRKDPDGAIRALAKRFDKADLKDIEVGPAELAAAEAKCPQTVQNAIRSMYDSVVRYHRQDPAKGFEIEPVKGVRLGKLVVPFDRAGLYVPGGLAVYPSCVVMAAAPARVAGVKELVLCTPPREDGSVPEAVLVAALVCGVSRVFKVGGAQAVFAMAFGTPSVPKCDIIAGPGNAFVTEAKRRVQETTAIDFLAGPTELLVVSDGSTSPRYIAAELVGQAEHSPDTCCVLVTTSEAQAKEVARELEAQTASTPRGEIVRASMEGSGALLTAGTLDEALAFANEFAAEHLTLSTKYPSEALKKVKSAGSVFLGEWSPVALGDYGAGPNAILPTYGEAGRRGGLSSATFQRTVSYQMLSKEGLEALAPTALTLARVENLEAHRRSIEVRLGP